jgi:uncharacterized protein
MIKLYVDYIKDKLAIAAWQVENCIELLEGDATVPFISRYRKEKTGALDEMQVSEIKHYFIKFGELEKRKESILKSIEEQGKLSVELKDEILNCVDSQRLEDLYLPFKPKRRTRATVARENGLEPLAKKIFEYTQEDCYSLADKFINDKVKTNEEALAGARDIIAEWVSEDVAIRESLRGQFLKFGKLTAKRQKDTEDEESAKYRNYFDFSGSLNNIPAHRLLAVLRGEKEGHLQFSVETDTSYCLNIIRRRVLPQGRKCGRGVLENLESAMEDSYKRLLEPSIENESVKIAKERADLESVRVFGENLSALLLAPPVGQKNVLAIDPGFRTGCKVVCLNSQGELVHNDTIYPHPPVNERSIAIKKISYMVEAYKIEIIAIGDGTAGRETEAFIKKIALPEGVRVFSVNEDGASVYSASSVAREEFPDYDVTVRGAVSIGRRLMDPLAELVKIDPKSIGVGQYQHDVDQSLLKEMLDNTVINCVNRVGVNLNTASKHLLSYVSGLGPALAQNIIDYRTENGPFASRRELLKVKRLGNKAFEQAAGFLRIPGAKNPLDNSAVHPERYELVEKIAVDLNCSVTQLIKEELKREQIKPDKYVSGEVGLLTLNDIISELAKPGRDPREGITFMEFSSEISSIEDLIPGMILPGIVTNITNFGAFVDIGIKQDGLVHISQMSDKFISSPSEVVKLNQAVQVKVLEIDLVRKRIQLSMKLK